MHKKYTLSASALLIALLTACSSGGGSGSSPSTPPQKQLQPEGKPEVPQPEAKPEMSQPEAKPEMPQPEGKPEVPQPEAKPEMPQPEAKPEVPQPEAKPEVPQPEAKPEMPQPEPKPEVPQPEAKPEIPQPKYTGVYVFEDVKNGNRISLSVDKLPNTENLDTITINGKSISLLDTKDKSISWKSHQAPLNSSNNKKYDLGPVRLEHSIFGIYNTDVSGINNRTYKSQGFSLGEQTPENALPTAGIIQYVGNAWVHEDQENVFIYNANFSADFTKKTLNGTFDAGSGYDISLPESKIEGSSFIGNTEHISIRGSFYGDKAQELGGVAAGVDDKSNRQFSAAFGAKQKTE